MVNVQALVYDGFDEMDLIGAFETLGMAGFNVALKSLYGPGVVSGAYGLKVSIDESLSLNQLPELLLVPGGGWLNRAPRGAWAEAQSGRILRLLSEVHQHGVVIATVCTGSLLLGKAALLTGVPATTNHAAVDELISFGANYIPARVVDAGSIITAGGITCSIDLGLWLVERFVSQKIALDVSARLEFDRRGVVWTGSAARADKL